MYSLKVWKGTVAEEVCLTAEGRVSPLDLLSARSSVRLSKRFLGCVPYRDTFIEAIDGVRNRRSNFWVYYVNGRFAEAPVDKYVLSDGDVVEFKYLPCAVGVSRRRLATATRITIMLDKTSARLCNDIVISGSLYTAAKETQQPIPGKTVRIYRAVNGGGYSLIGSATTNAEGNYSFTAHASPVGTHGYYAEFPGDADYDASSSGLVTLSVTNIFTYPENPDAWCEETLSPSDGIWAVIYPAAAQLSLDANAAVGNASVKAFLPSGYSWLDVKFSLNEGREFDGTKPSAMLNFYINLPTGWYPLFDVYLYDTAGRVASRKNIGVVADGTFHHFALPLGLGQGWAEASGFDWRFLKAIMFRGLVDYPWPAGNVWIDEFHFSYYELVRPTLAIDSVPQGKSYTLDGVSGATPSPPYGLDPGVDYSVYIDPVDFDRWEDGSTANPRTIRLAEGENKVITAYYTTAPPPPPPGKGTLYCRAFANSDEVVASVQVVGVGTYTTPFSLDLDPAIYTLKASYKDQTQQKSATVFEGKITEVRFSFAKPAPPGIDWTPLILAAGVIGAVIVISQV